jgi:hypothetical protein
MTKNIVKNQLIVEFLGYKLASCNNGFAWVSPFKYSVEDVLGIHGRLFNLSSTYLKFDSSWEWLMPVAIKIAKEHRIDCIAKRFTMEEIHNDVVEAIEFINAHKR